MSNGATKNYDFGPKRHWRRTVWNRVKSELSVPASDAVVLYLPGPHDFDREIAIEKGFKDKNLIAIERDSRIVSKLRRDGKLVANCDFIDALNSLNRPVHFVFGDFCKGVDFSTFKGIFTASQFNKNLENTIFALNFQRGREIDNKAMRDATLDMHDSKHRGQVFLTGLIQYIAELAIINEHGLDESDFDGDLTSAQIDFISRFYKTHLRDFFDEMLIDPGSSDKFGTLFSYKSGVLNFDSLIFKNKLILNLGNDDAKFFRKSLSVKSAVRALAPILAIRTQRLAA